MTVAVRLFALLRDRAGASIVTLTVPEPATAGTLLAVFESRLPESAALIRRSRVAVNEEYVSLDRSISVDDDIAILPPVSGG